MNTTPHAATLAQRYLDAVLQGDEAGAALVLQEGLHRGLAPMSVYLDVLVPSQSEVGRRWHEGQINVAQEHRATQIGLGQMDRLRQLMRPRARLDLRAVVTALAGDQHWVGARVVADFLLMDGWQVDFLGADTPVPDLVEYTQQRGAQLVALSLTVPESVRPAKAAIRALRKLDPAPRVLVGGAAFWDRHELAEEIGADGVAGDALEAVQAARRLMSLDGAPAALPDYLRQLGGRVQARRKAQGWSQQQLAKASGLDRTYISAVEHGKQNLTLGAVSRLAAALNVPLFELLTGGGGAA